MIIKNLEIISFGKFKNQKFDLHSGLNLFSGNNESGKTTIMSFIFAMLYGFGDNRGKNLSLREKYTPWDGGVCEGKLTLENDDGETLTLYRKAGSVKKNDVFKVYNSESGEEYNLSSEDLTGIGSDTFSKTLYIKQLSTVFTEANDEIVQKLSNIASGGDENISFEKALKALETARRKIRPQRGNGGELHQINFEIAEAEKNHSLYSSVAAKLDSDLSSLPKYEKATDDANKKLYEESSKDFSSPIAHLRGRIEEKELNAKNVAQNGSIFSKLPLRAFLRTAALIAILFSVLLSPFFLVLSIIFISLSFIPIKKGNASVKDTELDSLLDELSRLEKEKAAHDEKLVSLREYVKDCEKNLSALKISIESAQLQLSSLKKSDTDVLYGKKENLEKNLSYLTLAIDALSGAHEKIKRNFTPHLTEKASEYFSFITEGKYARIFSDDRFNLSLETDIPRKSEFFSGGTVDQLYLSLRLALADMIFPSGKTFLLLDQPFLQYDTPRRKKTLELLANMSDKRQVLLFGTTFSSDMQAQNIDISRSFEL